LTQELVFPLTLRHGTHGGNAATCHEIAKSGPSALFLRHQNSHGRCKLSDFSNDAYVVNPTRRPAAAASHRCRQPPLHQQRQSRDLCRMPLLSDLLPGRRGGR
jgi:hypothetical protein